MRIADELHDALRSAAVKGSYILVGLASGGGNVHSFAQRHLADTAGLCWWKRMYRVIEEMPAQ